MAGVCRGEALSSDSKITHTQVEIDQEGVLDCTEDIMEAVDVNGDRDITRVGRDIFFNLN